MKDATGKIICILGQNNFPIDETKILSHPLNRDGYSTTGRFYGLRSGDTVGAILVSNNREYMRVLGADGKEIAKFFAGAK